MRIYLWTALRIMVLRMRGLWFLKEGFEVEIFLATERTETTEIF